MSYKIRDQIAKLKGVPAKHKRVLDAWASFADKDGTNIYASKEAVAERAGISRWTVYRNTDDLVDIGVLVDTGDTHKYGAGHYTTVYRIDIAMLQNATLVGEKLCSVTGWAMRLRSGTIGTGTTSTRLASSCSTPWLKLGMPCSQVILDQPDASTRYISP
jgi:hypothetical protein